MWRGRDFRLAWAGGLVNDTGDWVLLVGLPVYVFTETGSGTSTAIVFVCELVVAALFGALGGSLVDQWNLRRCLIATNLAQAVMLLPLLAVRPDRVWPAYVAVVGQALLTQLNNPANVALIPRVVQREQLTAANAALAASTSLARLVGAPLGGLLVAVSGLRAVVLVDLVSFLAVGVAMVFVRADTDPIPRPDGVGEDPHPIRTGLREINRRPVLRGVVSIGGISQIAQGGFVVLFVVFVVERLGRDGTDVGIIRGTMAIGAVVGAALIARLADRVDPLRLIVAGFTGMGLMSLGVLERAAGERRAVDLHPPVRVVGHPRKRARGRHRHDSADAQPTRGARPSGRRDALGRVDRPSRSIDPGRRTSRPRPAQTRYSTPKRWCTSCAACWRGLCSPRTCGV